MKVLMIRMASKIGGAEIYNLNLIRGFKKYYPAVEIFFLTNLPEFAQKVENIEPKPYILPVFNEEIGSKRGLGRLIFGFPKYLFYFLKTILFLRIKKNVKLIVFQGTTEKIVLTPLFKLLKFRLIWLEHGPFFAFKKTWLVLFLYKLFSRLVEKIITVSKDSQKNIINSGVSESKVICIQTGIDNNYFSPLSEPDIKKSKVMLKIKNNELIVGYSGAICREKGIRDFIKVAELICQEIKNVKFVLVGKGPMLNWGKRFAIAKGLKSRFVFTGFKKDIRPFLGIFDIFFFPTHHFEGLSLALLEAMAMGVPVVARDIGGNKELVVHGKTGYLFKDESSGEIAQIIIDLLSDSEKRKQMGNAARRRVVEHFNLKDWVTKLHRIFEDCL